MKSFSFYFILFILGSSEGNSQMYIHNVPEAIITVESTEEGAILALSAQGRLYGYNGSEYSLLHEGMEGASQLKYSNEGHLVISSTGIWKWHKNDLEHQALSESCYDYIEVEQREYVLTSTGMFLFKEGRYQLVNDWTTPISENAKFHNCNDDYFLSNDNSIYQYKSNTWKIFARDTLPINDLVIYNDELWAATDSGLRIINNRRMKEVVLEGIDMFMKIERLFVIDNSMYIQGEGDIYKWSANSIEAHRIDVKTSPSEIVKDAWGDLWYAEEGNIIQQKKGDNNIISPIIAKVEVSVNGVAQSGDEIVIDKEGSDIKIEYLANHLRNPLNIKYQSRFTPLEDKFQDATTDKSVVYSDVPAGDFSYRLRSSIDGVNYTYYDPIKIKVKPLDQLSFWWWIVVGVGVGLLALALLSNYRLQQYKERSVLLTSKLRTANELLASQQKTMQLQMNPHFLFNALNSIQGLVALKRNDEAKIYLRKFSRMMRSVLDFSTVDKIDLKNEIDYLNDYLSIEQMTRSNAFDYNIEVDESLLDEDIQLPPMILQPFIENAIIHGVSSIKNGRITVSIKDLESKIQCVIIDNGIGREAAMSKRKASHKSMAISLAKERLLKMSKASTEELITYKDSPNGTQVDIMIPLN